MRRSRGYIELGDTELVDLPPARPVSGLPPAPPPRAFVRPAPRFPSERVRPPRRPARRPRQVSLGLPEELFSGLREPAPSGYERGTFTTVITAGVAQPPKKSFWRKLGEKLEACLCWVPEPEWDL